MLENVSIILVEPSGDENVGMVARAMKNCGLTDLRLVNPARFRTSGAKKWACNAKDVLHKARVFKTLKDAAEDTALSVGLSRREGKLRPPSIADTRAPIIIYGRSKKGRVALIFGREADGLARDELQLCDYIWTLPTSTMYPSLNLAQAVMVAAHEIYKEHEYRRPKIKVRIGEEAFVPKMEIAPVVEDLSRALFKLGYDDSDGGKLRRKILREFETLFGRGGLFYKDINMFLGLTARIAERVRE